MKKLTKLSLLVLALCGFPLMHAQVPPTAPPDLPYDAENVLSFFSEKYGEAFPDMTSIWGTDDNQTTKWSYTATADQEAGLIAFRDLDWLALALGGNAQLKNYYYIHIDVYCNEDTEFRIGFQRHDAGDYPALGETYFPMIEKGTMQPGKWYSIDYDLDEFFEGPWGGGADAHYLRIGGREDGDHDWSNEIYITNFVAFSGDPTCLGGVVRDETGIANAKENASFNAYIKNGSLNYSSAEAINQLNVYNTTGQLVASFDVNAIAGKSDVSNIAPGVYVISASIGENIVTKKVIK